MEWIILVLALLLLGGIAAMLAMTLPIAGRVYEEQLVRTTPEKWGRTCSCPENEEQQAMWDAGCAWAEAHKAAMEEVSMVCEGLNLYGEFYHLYSESKRCVLILPGRCESLKYSYYFAPAYERAGFNVLVVDTRAHGNSDGRYNTIGVAESRDALAWVEMLRERFGMEEIYFHTICIGTVSGLLAMTSPECPDSVRGIVSEGCFTTFRESFKRHMMADKRPLFPVLDLVMLLLKIHTGTNVLAASPLRAVRKLKGRALFLYGKQDIFSVPEKSQQLFDRCKSPDKRLVWFEKGGHSHLRINNETAYDQAIVDFLKA